MKELHLQGFVTKVEHHPEGVKVTIGLGYHNKNEYSGGPVEMVPTNELHFLVQSDKAKEYHVGRAFSVYLNEEDAAAMVGASAPPRASESMDRVWARCPKCNAFHPFVTSFPGSNHYLPEQAPDSHLKELQGKVEVYCRNRCGPYEIRPSRIDDIFHDRKQLLQTREWLQQQMGMGVK